MYLVLASDTVTEGQLYDYANTQVGERISILPGVSQVAVYGTQSAVRIKADPSAMAMRDITMDDLTTAIKNGHELHGSRAVRWPAQTFSAAAARTVEQGRRIRQPDRGQNERRAGLSEGRGEGDGQRAGRADQHAVLGARASRADGAQWWSRCSGGRDRTRCKWPRRCASCCPSIQSQTAAVGGHSCRFTTGR